MRRLGRPRLRAELQATDVPTFSGARPMAQTADAVRFLRAPGSLPPGRRVYAIGDVHGCRDQLASLYALIAADLQNRPTRHATLVTLGNHLIQGPDPAGTVALLTCPPAAGVTVVSLLGDQEAMLLDALNGERAAATDFLWAGGRQTFLAWGIDPDLPRERWEAALPPKVLRWLRGLALTHRAGRYLFVHAGIRPGVPINRQSREDLLTIRQPFLSSEQDHGVIVVHGHASTSSVHIGVNRIGLDTGAGSGGKLTCAVLEDDVIGLFAA
jgi:serine/threonine protein phosphatase 1